ncbi:hypothetical protein BKA70DRAFT_1429027 [Coprinopsis sp. MPI-PUGE-AT-0042]|nr:hypothetical protein BKA70DRAFT_1429027 [Coprinopsis sp. MPI-PUGE-AT-0042]
MPPSSSDTAPSTSASDAEAGQGRGRGHGRGCGRGARSRGRGAACTPTQQSQSHPDAGDVDEEDPLADGPLTSAFQVHLTPQAAVELQNPQQQTPVLTSINEEVIHDLNSFAIASNPTSVDVQHSEARGGNTRSSSPSEYINPQVSPSSSTAPSPSGRSTTLPPSQPGSPSHPRAGPRSQNRRQTHKRSPREGSNQAKDVWNFYNDDEKNGKRLCKYCVRDCHGSRRFHVKKFGLNTSTTVLRTHLVESHHFSHPRKWASKVPQI